MKHPPFTYPGTDEAPYLDWYEGTFHSVFVAFNPFLQLSGFPPWTNGNWTPEQVVRAAKQAGPRCGVSWARIARLCGLSSAAHVNRALRLTGSRRLAAQYASPDDTRHMIAACKAADIYPPDEGCPSPLLELAMGGILAALGHQHFTAADCFGTSPEKKAVSDLLDQNSICDFGQLWTGDHSVFAAIYRTTITF
jgi:hypothetical protein